MRGTLLERGRGPTLLSQWECWFAVIRDWADGLVVDVDASRQQFMDHPQANFADDALREAERKGLASRNSEDHLYHEDAAVIVVVLNFGGVGDHIGAHCPDGRRVKDPQAIHPGFSLFAV